MCYCNAREMANSNLERQIISTEAHSNNEVMAYNNEVSDDDSDTSSNEDVFVEHRLQKMDIPTAQVENCTDVQMGHRLHYHAPVVINQNFLSGTSSAVADSLNDHHSHQALTAQILNNTGIGNNEVDIKSATKKSPEDKEPIPSCELLPCTRRVWILAAALIMINIAITSSVSLLITRTTQTRTDIISEVPDNASRWKSFKQFLDALQKHRNKSGDWSSLPVMVKYGDSVLVEIMLDNGANPDTLDYRGCTGLHIAAEHGSLKIVDLLIKHGANLSMPCIYTDGDLPIHKAAFAAQRKIVTRFLDEGVFVDARNIVNDTPLHLAVMKNDSDTTLLLIGRGADVNARNNANETALHHCAIFGYVKLANILINKGADVNARTIKMQTPLHFAVALDSVNMAELLVSRGANLTARDLQNETPFDLATPNIKKWLSNISNYTEQ